MASDDAFLVAARPASRGEMIPHHSDVERVLREHFYDGEPGQIEAIGLATKVIEEMLRHRELEKFSADAVAAYADVVRQGDAIYRQEQNDIQDRRAIKTFVDRFRALAALAR
jgi:hypothetical protein